MSEWSMNGKVEICGINTSILPKYTTKQLDEMMQKIKLGDMQAKQDFVFGNLRLVLSVVQRFERKRQNPDDLFQVGCVGLIKAIDNFDTTLNVKFSTYAVPMIAGEIKRFLRDSSALRVSRSLRDIAYRSLKAREKLASISNSEPTMEQIAEELGVSLRLVNSAMEAISDPISLSEPMYSDDMEASELSDYITDQTDSADKWLDNVSIKDALQALNPRERRILILRYYLGRTQVEVSDEVGISQAQVSRLEKSALKVVKKFFV